MTQLHLPVERVDLNESLAKDLALYEGYIIQSSEALSTWSMIRVSNISFGY
jgi:hypothetical protein